MRTTWQLACMHCSMHVLQTHAHMFWPACKQCCASHKCQKRKTPLIEGLSIVKEHVGVRLWRPHVKETVCLGPRPSRQTRVAVSNDRFKLLWGTLHEPFGLISCDGMLQKTWHNAVLPKHVLRSDTPKIGLPICLAIRHCHRGIARS